LRESRTGPAGADALQREASSSSLPIAEGNRAVAMRPLATDPIGGAGAQELLARILLMVGEPGQALDRFEPLLKLPYGFSPGWLRINPRFAPLRGNPRFERLVAGK
jgi:hypothetical protein